ncbi:MAG: TolC family protein [Deltaproteobacteria bacterium]|nr:TolC family protein [Deltaproteobacteria bacterium]
MNALSLVTALLLAQAAPGPKLLTFDDAVREAQARSADLQAMRGRLDAARTIGWKAWSNHLPQVTASGTYLRNDSRLAFPLSPALTVVLQPGEVVTGQVQATVPLIAPSLWFGISAAGHGQAQAEWTLESARREILFGVAQLYYGSVGARYAVRITEKQLAVALDHEKDARVRYQAGTTPKVALLRAEIDRSRAEADLKAAQAGFDSARTALATFLDRRDTDFDVEIPPEQPPAAMAGDLEASAVARPDVLAAREAVAVAERSRGAVWARYLPSVGAFGRYVWQDPKGLNQEHASWAIGLSASWTLFDGTLREAELSETGAKRVEAEASLRAAEVRAREEVVRGKLDLDAALANRQKAKETVELARENHRLVEVNYRAGAATYLEVSDAQNQLLTAEIANVAEDLKARLAALRLLKAAGRFDPK